MFLNHILEFLNFLYLLHKIVFFIFIFAFKYSSIILKLLRESKLGKSAYFLVFNRKWIIQYKSIKDY